MTFAFDTDVNGVADFQIQYNKDGNGEWQISYVESGSWGEWSDVPSEFELYKSGDEFTLKMPISELVEVGTDNPQYKFGVDANDAGGGQTFYSTDPEHLWYNGDNYVSSDYYFEMDVTPIENDDSVIVPAESSVEFAVVNDFQVGTYPGTYNITTEVSAPELEQE